MSPIGCFIGTRPLKKVASRPLYVPKEVSKQDILPVLPFVVFGSLGLIVGIVGVVGIVG